MEKELTLQNVRVILHSYTNGEDVSQLHFDSLMRVFSHHESWIQKKGVGIKRIWVQQNPKYPSTRNFWIERIDGTTTDISFYNCFRGGKNDFKKACREAVEYQIAEFRERDNTPYGYHVDHHPESFDSILARFIINNGEGKVRETIDNEIGCQLENIEYKKRWQDFHKESANLRSILAQENLRKKRT